MATENAGKPLAGSRVPLLVPPLRLIRIAAVVHGVLEEIHAAPLDDLGRHRALELLRSCVTELRQCLEPDTRTELQGLLDDLDDAGTSDATLRIAHATVVGWLDGLLQRLQATWSAEFVSSMRPAGGRSGTGSGDQRERLMGRYL